MKHPFSRCFYSVLLLLWLAGAQQVGAQHTLSSKKIKAFEKHVRQVQKDWGIPGIAIGIIKGDKVVYSKGFGLRNIKNTLPVTPKTLFPIASCSKAMTSAVAAKLVAQQKLDWDAPVSQ